LAYKGKDPLIKIVTTLNKDANGFATLTEDQVNDLKLFLLEYAGKTDYLFDQNVVKTLIGLLTENIHFVLDENQKVKEVYVDVASLILSLDKEFIAKNKKSSVASGAWYINPRLFFTIGTSTGFFFSNKNMLDKAADGSPAALKNVTIAAEKIGFRVKLWDGGYTHRRNLFQWAGAFCGSWHCISKRAEYKKCFLQV